MSRLRIHAVEVHEGEGGRRLSIVQALCGLHLASTAAWFLGPARAAGTADLSWEDYFALRRKTRVYDDTSRPWYTVEEFCEGEEGSDDIDCVKCRKLLEAAIERYWRPEDREQ